MKPSPDHQIIEFIDTAHNRLDGLVREHSVADDDGKVAIETHIGEIFTEIEAAFALAELMGWVDGAAAHHHAPMG